MGPQFRSAEIAEFLRVNGVEHIRVTSKHPASNDTAERMVQKFKRSLQASAGKGVPVCKRLADFLLRYRTTPHSLARTSPAKLMLRHQCHIRMTLLRPSLESKVLEKQSAQLSGQWREF